MDFLTGFLLVIAGLWVLLLALVLIFCLITLYSYLVMLCRFLAFKFSLWWLNRSPKLQGYAADHERVRHLVKTELRVQICSKDHMFIHGSFQNIEDIQHYNATPMALPSLPIGASLKLHVEDIGGVAA